MISVIIVSWNTRALTLAAARSALAQEVDEPVEVIVVDNASSDDTLAALGAALPAVRGLAVPRNVGFARGNNLGLRRARGEWTLLLNSDAELRPGCLQALLEAARAEPRAALVQPLWRGDDGRVQASWEYRPGLVAELALVLWGRRRARSAAWQAAVARWRAPRRVGAVGLAALFVPSWVWRRIGPLSEEMFLFFEEADLCERVARAGWPMLLVPGAEVLHHGGASTGQVPQARRRAHYLSRLGFYRTHRGRAASEVIRQLSLLRAALGLLTAPPAARDELWRPVFRAAWRGVEPWPRPTID